MTKLAVMALMAGCDVPEQGLSIMGAASPNDDCVYAGDTDTFTSRLVLDTDLALGLEMGLVVRNNLSTFVVEVGTEDTTRKLTPPSEATPLRYEARWECDSNGFSGNTGSLVLPGFDPVVPFCLDKRADTTEGFFGVDILPASGAPVEGNGGKGIAMVTAVPHDLGFAVDELFNIAVLADVCCKKAGTNCEGNDLGGGAGDACVTLDAVFRAIAPDQLSVATRNPGQPSEDLTRFSAFAKFDGQHYAPPPDPDGVPYTPRYNMRLRGVLEAVTGDGSFIRSNDFSIDVQFCRRCGPVDVTGNKRRSYYESVADDPDQLFGSGRGAIGSGAACAIN
ncbi:MAG: hypothetical protein IT384_00340 [Deltaproteobacteria bacterium]|nr:hypothetical protein [Deltaproteobacteria bacterium]